MKPHRPPERYNTHFKTGMPWIRAIQELPDLLGVPQPLALADAAHLGEGSPSQQRGFQQCHCHIAAPRFPAHPEVYHWATHTAAYSCTKQLYSVCFNCAQVHSWSGHRRETQKRRCWPAALLQIASMLISLTWATRVTYHISPQPLHTLLALPGSLSLLSDFEGHVSVSRSSIRDLTPQVSLQSKCSYLCQQLRTSMNKESSGSV